MRLSTLKLRNFKGLTFELETYGRDIYIFGDNDTGKTRLADSFSWLFFGKDTRNQSEFEIKSLDKNGNPIHNLEHEVEAELELSNGKELTLRKIYYEKWTKKRGSATETFSGHTTDHYINGVPVKQSDYTAKIAEIADEDIFRLITNPLYFNEVLHWEDRRSILLDVCGNVSDDDVISSNTELSKLKDILSERGIEDQRKIIKAKQKKINEELDRIPIRIDEVDQGLPNVAGEDEDSLRRMISYRKGKIKEKEEEISRLESGGEVAEKTKQLREIESELLNIKNLYQEESESLLQEKRQELRGIQDQIGNINHSIKAKKRDIESNSSDIEQLEKIIEDLRKEWHQTNEQVFEFEQKEVCPACGQDIPKEQLEDAREKALADFNQKKADRLEKISEEGKTRSGVIKDLKKENVQYQSEIEVFETTISELKETASGIKSETDTILEKTSSLEDNPEYLKKLEEKELLEQAIQALKEGRQDEAEATRKDIEQYEEEISDLEKQLARIEQYDIGKSRIEELKAQEKNLAQEYEQLEKELYLLEQFTRAKVNMLEEKINYKFQLAEFRLFEAQINGGIKEVCECLYNGVPYRNLDGSAPLKVGLDIINVLSEHYDFIAPIFIDNAERIIDLPNTRGQLIALVVSAEDKTLRVKYADEQGEELELEREAV